MTELTGGGMFRLHVMWTIWAKEIIAPQHGSEAGSAKPVIVRVLSAGRSNTNNKTWWRDDTAPWVCCCCCSGSLVARCRTAPVQQIVPTLAPQPAGNVGGRHVSDVWQCPSSLKMPTKSLHTLRIGKVKTFEAGCLTSKWDACLHTASDFHWHAVLI